MFGEDAGLKDCGKLLNQQIINSIHELNTKFKFTVGYSALIYIIKNSSGARISESPKKDKTPCDRYTSCKHFDVSKGNTCPYEYYKDMYTCE